MASLAAFRILFGAVLAIAALRFIAKGWVTTQFVAPSYHFAYPHFEFVRPWPGRGMYLHFALLVLAALSVALGSWYRLSALCLALGFSYIELLDRATYLNHYYLAGSIAWLLVFMPAAGALSVDAARVPARRVTSMPRFLLLVLRVQVGVVYVFAGLAKLNADWLLRAEPLRIWLAARSDLPLIGALLAQKATAVAASWLGALFDLSIVGLLLWPRTRRVGFGAAVGFHTLTGLLFPIGMFPWIMLACATLFFEPGWPRRWLGLLVAHASRAQAAPSSTRQARPRRATVALLSLHSAMQMLVPLHHHALCRDSAWTCEGFDFAWKIMVVEKTGFVRFEARDRRTGSVFSIDPRNYLSAAQERAMAQDPRLIRDLARYIRIDLLSRSGRDVAVYADAFATLNGRPAQRLIAANVDLTLESLPQRWILPLM